METYLIEAEEFSIKCEDYICYIDLFAAGSKNAISLKTASFMEDIIAKSNATKSDFEIFLEENKAVLIVMRSLVKNIFSSGGHLLNLLELTMTNKKEGIAYANAVREFCKILSKISIPSITILSGNAYGGGAELAFSTDFRWSIGKKIEFHLSQTKFGVPGGWSGMSRLTEINPTLTSKKVSTFFLAQEILTYEDLCRLSLIDKTFDHDEDCYKHLYHWRDKIISCDPNLRNDLQKRAEHVGAQLEEYDVSIFNKYFLSKMHTKELEKFIKQKPHGRPTIPPHK